MLIINCCSSNESVLTSRSRIPKGWDWVRGYYSKLESGYIYSIGRGTRGHDPILQRVAAESRAKNSVVVVITNELGVIINDFIMDFKKISPTNYVEQLEIQISFALRLFAPHYQDYIKIFSSFIDKKDGNYYTLAGIDVNLVSKKFLQLVEKDMDAYAYKMLGRKMVEWRIKYKRGIKRPR